MMPDPKEGRQEQLKREMRMAMSELLRMLNPATERVWLASKPCEQEDSATPNRRGEGTRRDTFACYLVEGGAKEC